MDSRPKRTPRKSAKLLSYQQELNRHENKKLIKKYIKSEPGIQLGMHAEPDVPKQVRTEPSTLEVKMEPHKELQLQLKQLTVPKLKIKLSGFNQSAGDVVAETGSVSEEKKLKKRKEEMKDTPTLKKARVVEGSSPMLPNDVEPTDVEIEADDVVFETMGGFDSEEVSESGGDRSPASKRQRKLPVKFESDDYDIETDVLSNKAAKFFETKKAEQKAASAIDKCKRVGEKTKRNRMPNAYNMWSNSHRLKLKAQSPGISFAVMNKKLGEAWRTLPIKEKNIWARKAKRLATHGVPKNTESMKFLGSKAIASLQRNNLPVSNSSKGLKTVDTETSKFADLKPVYKVTQTEPVDIAAHFVVMSETFNTIGTGLAKKGDAKVQGSLNMLLDSLLCSVSALMCLTQQVPELDGDVDPETHRQRMANIAYYIPDI